MVAIWKTLYLTSSIKSCAVIVVLMLGVQLVYLLILYNIVLSYVTSIVNPVVEVFRTKGLDAHRVCILMYLKKN